MALSPRVVYRGRQAGACGHRPAQESQRIKHDVQFWWW